MANPTIKFTALPYEVNGYKGYRPLLMFDAVPCHTATLTVGDCRWCNDVV